MEVSKVLADALARVCVGAFVMMSLEHTLRLLNVLREKTW